MFRELFFTPPPAGVISYFLAAGWIFAALRFSWIHRPDSRDATVILAVPAGIVAFIPAGVTLFDQLRILFGDDSQLETNSNVPFKATMICLMVLMVFGWSMLISILRVSLKERPHLLGAAYPTILSFIALWTAALLGTIDLGGKTDSGSHPLKTTVEYLLVVGFLLAWVSAVIYRGAEKRYEDACRPNSDTRRGITEKV